MRKLFIAVALGLLLPVVAGAETELEIKPVTITEWKAVFGKVESRDRIPARARLGGTLVSIDVEEGSTVAMGQVIGRIYDAKLGLQLQSIDAQIGAVKSQLENAQTELTRGEDLLKRGVTTVQRLDALRTQVNVLENQIESTEAQKRVIEEQSAEGAVLAPISGKILNVPVTAGSVLMPGEVVATIGGGGFFLRLAVPERHAAFLKEGADILIGNDTTEQLGRLAKVYPQIENGRVIADVELSGLDSAFVDARVLVRLPVGEATAIVVPANMITTRMGLDFVTVKSAGGKPTLQTVVPGEIHMIESAQMIEILSGLAAGDIILPPSAMPVVAPSHGDAAHE